jgi:two-component system, sensor histidine kinase RpfC
MTTEGNAQRKAGVLRRLTAPLRRRLRGRPDSEHEMTINRIVISSVVLIYLLVASARGHGTAQEIFHEALLLFAIYYACSIALFIHILYDPGVSHPRRIVAITLDIGMLSYGMHVGESAFAIGYPLYLWIIIGNGFRFGVKYLIGAALWAIAGFCFLIAMTPLWRNNLELSFGLLAGLFILPAYVSALIRKLSEAKLQAEQANRAKTLFLASISHELRTPLNAIITLADLLRGAPIPREQREMTVTIAMSGRSLLKMINSLLDLSQREARNALEPTQPFNLLASLQAVRRVLSATTEAKGLSLTMLIEPGVQAQVVGPKQSLEEILTNLIGNATKFTQAGGIHVTVAPNLISDDKHILRFSVRDTGIGIAEAAQRRIFERFTQADETIVGRFGGTGLGLAIVKQLVKRHGGEIGVNSVVGEGSEFWFTIPFEAQAPAVETDQPAPSVVLLSNDFRLYTQLALECGDVARLNDPRRAIAAAADRLDEGKACVFVLDPETMPSDTISDLMTLDPERSVLGSCAIAALSRDGTALKSDLKAPFLLHLGLPVQRAQLAQLAALTLLREELDDQHEGEGSGIAPLRVLIAEDNVTNQIVIRRLLERDRHQVTIVDNGEQAVEVMLKQSFDIVLMDINMPVMNGLEATKLYRFAMPGAPRLPIYALTADVTDETRRLCHNAGLDGCLHKPIEQGELLQAFRACKTGAAVLPKPVPAAALPAELPFNLESVPVLDLEALNDLLALGDMAFMYELIDEFLASAVSTLDAIADAVAREDVTAFQEVLHALRSSSANIGAKRVFALALEWRATTLKGLTEFGEERVQTLRSVFAEAEDALRAWLAEKDRTAKRAV